jgi:Putative prokaryotic signal transducing protein
MYCPQCKSEYREGFTTCSECQVPLVAELSEEDETVEGEEDSGIKILLETSHPTDLEPLILKLEEQGIPYILQSGTALSMMEGRLVTTLPEDWRAVVLVPSEHLPATHAIISELKSGAAAEDSEQE